MARAIVRAAYGAGARPGDVRYSDQHVRRAAIELGPEEMLGLLAANTCSSGSARWPETRPAVISLTGDARPASSSTTSTRRSSAGPSRARSAGSTLPLVSERLHQLGDRRVAERGLGDDGVRRAGSRAALGGRRHATRLDAPDPVAAWREHDAKLKARSDALNERRFDAIRFRGPGRISSSACCRPRAGSARLHDRRAGSTHIPNLPTEEVFTSPDWRRDGGDGALDDAALGRAAPSSAISRCASRPARSSTSRPRPAPRSSAASSRQTRRRRTSARSRSSTATRAVKKTGHRLRRHPVRRERDLPHRLRHRAADGASRAPRALDRTSCSRLGVNVSRRAHGLHDRRRRGRRRRPRPRRRRDADHPRRRLGARWRRPTAAWHGCGDGQRRSLRTVQRLGEPPERAFLGQQLRLACRAA